MIKKVEKDGQCIYCNNVLNGIWESDFSAGHHYKCTICTCGKENCVEVKYAGSGHDNWGELEKKVVSSSVKVIEPNVRILK